MPKVGGAAQPGDGRLVAAVAAAPPTRRPGVAHLGAAATETVAVGLEPGVSVGSVDGRMVAVIKSLPWI